MTQADDALAKKRFFALSIMRLMGAAFVAIGFILIAAVYIDQLKRRSRERA